MNEKECTKCGETKNITEFHKSKSHKDGFHSQCKKCKNEYRKRRRECLHEKEKEKIQRLEYRQTAHYKFLNKKHQERYRNQPRVKKMRAAYNKEYYKKDK